MISFVAFVAIFAAAEAIVCVPQLCESFQKKDQKPIQCKGAVIKNGGFCGCTDACAKVEGEKCQATSMFGMIPVGTCDTGLTCVAKNSMILGHGTCVDVSKTTKRDVLTHCQQMKRQNMMMMIVWSGQWVGPKCDADGNFLPEQCNRGGECFCVTKVKGTVLSHTKVRGSAHCSQDQAN